MSRKYKADELLANLTDEEREAYKAMLRQPASTIDDALSFFEDRGMQISRGAVWKHKRNFQEQTESLQRSAELSRAFMDMARTESVESMASAALLRMTQVLMEQAMRLDAEGDLSPKDLLQMTQAIRHNISGKNDVLDLQKRQRDAIAEAERLVKRGGSGADVVSTIKQALGITASPGNGGGA